MKDKLPFVSVVVCTYNGEKRIEDCLKSLINQDYPKDKYEIIIIDDGSIDKTTEIVSKYKVRLIKHQKNLGICLARDTGLWNADGEIVIYTDDDCIAKKDWLKNLLRVYKKDVIAVGGLTIPFSCNTIMEKYMAEIGYGNPAPIEFGKSKNPLYRFSIYLKDMFLPITTTKEDPIQVHSIYTLNASFKKKVLKEAGGWEKGVDFREDAEMCDKLNQKFSNNRILFTKKAVVIHKHRTSFFYFLKQTFMRSESTLKNYLKYNKIPPIFPFPILTILLSIFLGFINLWLFLISLILLPQLLYFWWPIKFFKKLKLYYLFFPYMQMLIESSTILGMLRGYFILKNETKHK